MWVTCLPKIGVIPQPSLEKSEKNMCFSGGRMFQEIHGNTLKDLGYLFGDMFFILYTFLFLCSQGVLSESTNLIENLWRPSVESAGNDAKGLTTVLRHACVHQCIMDRQANSAFAGFVQKPPSSQNRGFLGPESHRFE